MASAVLQANTSLSQDLALSTAFAELKTNPAALTIFLNAQQDAVYNNIINQKNNTFSKVSGDLDRGHDAQDAIVLNYTRSKDLINTYSQVYENQKHVADDIVENKNLSNRKNEMNEWTVNNKLDTLFVYSSIFIMLSSLLLITVLWRLNFISSVLWTALVTPLIIICIFIIINRSQYTNIWRNKRYWNKKDMPNKNMQTRIPSICPGLA